MSTGETVAILLDGGFVKKVLAEQLKKFPDVQDVASLCDTVMKDPALGGRGLFRVFFYDADPLAGTACNPLDRSTINFGHTPQARQNESLLQRLELQPNFAVRRGMLVLHGWKFRPPDLSGQSRARRWPTVGAESA